MKHLARNTGKFEWYTPVQIVDAARCVMGGIDLDPASSELANQNVLADRFYTIADDGLQLDWRADRVWLNPPYARGVIDNWIDKLFYEVARGHIGQWMCLVNNATDTRWAQRLLSGSSAVCFLRGRVRFETPDGADGKAPLQGQMVVYGGMYGMPRKLDFRRVFETSGTVF